MPWPATTTVVNAYLADTTPPQDRPRAYGYVGAAYSVGFVIGPVIGGLLGAVNLRLPFLLAATLAGANALYGAFVLPESRPGDRATSLAWRMANPISSIAAMTRRPGLGHLAVARLLADIARMTNQVTWTFVTIARVRVAHHHAKTAWSNLRLPLPEMLTGSSRPQCIDHRRGVSGCLEHGVGTGPVAVQVAQHLDAQIERHRGGCRLAQRYERFKRRTGQVPAEYPMGEVLPPVHLGPHLVRQP